MAGIDKTYTDNYKEYKIFKDWADTQNVAFLMDTMNVSETGSGIMEKNILITVKSQL